MSFFKNLLKGTKPADIDADPFSLVNPNQKSAGAEKRQFDRYWLFTPDLSWVELRSGARSEIVNLSYGGIACKAVAQLRELAAGSVHSITLKMLTRLIKAQVVVVAVRGGVVAFRFQHETAETLVALRDIIECLRSGASMKVMDKKILSDRYQSGEWSCYHGDGPADFVFRRGPSGELTQALMTFKADGERYAELSLKDGVLFTAYTTAPLTSKEIGASTARTKTLDLVVLERACITLMAMEPKSEDLIAQLINFMLEALEIKRTDAGRQDF